MRVSRHKTRSWEVINEEYARVPRQSIAFTKVLSGSEFLLWFESDVFGPDDREGDRVTPEYLDVVNKDDIVVGKQTRQKCVEQGLLHRAVVVFLKNDRGETYLQKRSSSVLFYPRYWCASATGHVSSGESYLEAARREMREELGIECQLSELGKFTSPKWGMGRLVEWEHIMVFEGVVDNPDIVLSAESEEGRFLSPRELKSLVEKQPGIFTPDTLLALKHYPIVP